MKDFEELVLSIVREKAVSKEAVVSIVKEIVDSMGVQKVTHEVQLGKIKNEVEGFVAKEFDDVLLWTTHQNHAGNFFPVILTGPAGTGKGSIARQVAEGLGAPFYEVNAVKNSYDLIGFVDANGNYIETEFYSACKDASEGREVVFLFDEMDCSEPEVIKVFNEAMSSFEFSFPNGETLEFPKMHFIGAMNTFGTGGDESYCGNVMDASTLDRFAMITIDYDRDLEYQLANKDADLVDFFDELRKVAPVNMITGYRSIQRIAGMIGAGMPIQKVFIQGLFKATAYDADAMMMIKDHLAKALPTNVYTVALFTGKEPEAKKAKRA